MAFRGGRWVRGQLCRAWNVGGCKWIVQLTRWMPILLAALEASQLHEGMSSR